jgi:hypothetical protein
MPGPGNANVQSLDALRDVRLSLIAFGDRTDSALGDLRSKIDRTMAWLQQDRPMYWQEQERRAYDGVASARIAYETCRMRTVGGRHSECIEEKIAFAKAKVRLEFCKHKIEVVRRWTMEAGRQVDEYRGRSGPLKRLIDEEVPNVVAMLSRMIDALEAYAEINAAPVETTPVSLGSGDEPRERVESTEPSPTGNDGSAGKDGSEK